MPLEPDKQPTKKKRAAPKTTAPAPRSDESPTQPPEPLPAAVPPAADETIVEPSKPVESIALGDESAVTAPVVTLSHSTRRPIVAATLSFIWPGAGQAFRGRGRDAVLQAV